MAGIIQRRSTSRATLSVLALAAASAAPGAAAADKYWVGPAPTGAWQTSGNWSATPGGPGGAGQPAIRESAFIESASDLTVFRDNTSTPPYVAPGLNQLRLDNTGANLTQLVFQGASGTAPPALYSSVMEVGAIGKAGVLHAGGDNTVSSVLTLGGSATGNGSYTLGDGATLKTRALVIGDAGTGVFNQTGGVTDLLGGTITLGKQGKGLGTLNLSGGTLTANAIEIGAFSPVGSQRRITLTGGTLTVTDAITTVNNSPIVHLNGGTLSVGSLQLNDPIQLFFLKGTLTLTGGETKLLGTNAFRIGLDRGVSTFNLGSGTLTVSEEDLGATNAAEAFFNQTGGTHTATGLYIGHLNGTSGTYRLSAGTLQTSKETAVGYLGNGTFEQSGGIHTTAFLRVGGFRPSIGSYSLTGGTLNAGGVILGNDGASGRFLVDDGAIFNAQYLGVGLYGTGLFEQTGGTTTLTGPLSVVPNFVDLSRPAPFRLSGGRFTAPAADIGRSDPNPSAGTARVSLTGGVMTIPGVVKVWNAGSRITIDGGTLEAGRLDLPAGGDASMLTLAGGGTWRHTGASAAMSHEFAVDAGGGTIDVSSASTVLTLGGQAAGAGALTKAGPGTLRVTGSLAGVAGLTVDAGRAEFPARQSLKALKLTSNGVAAIAGPNVAVIAQSLTVTDAGAVDVGDGLFAVDYTGASPLPALRELVQNGYQTGAWAGPGIRSARAAANRALAVGYAEAAEVLGPAGGTLLDATFDATTVLFRTTLAGDATLNGQVDFADLVLLAQNYNTNVSDDATNGSWWHRGDFTYDGRVDFQDLVKLAQNYNASFTPPAPAAGFEADLAAAFAAVPEPGPLAPAALAASWFTVRRRRTQARP